MKPKHRRDENISQVSPFINGFMPVSENGKWSFMDIKRKYICPFKYQKVYNFISGEIEITANNFSRSTKIEDVSFIRKAGKIYKIYLNEGFIRLSKLGTYQLAKVKLDGKCLYIDQNGNEYELET